MENIDILKIKRNFTKFIEDGSIDARVINTLIVNKMFLAKECELWDYKKQLNDDKVSLGKTILQIVSFYNTYGGFIIYGVQENRKGYECEPIGIQPNQFDENRVKKLVKQYTEESIEISYSELNFKIDSKEYLLGTLHIPKRGIEKTPVFLAKMALKKVQESVYLKRTKYISD